VFLENGQEAMQFRQVDVVNYSDCLSRNGNVVIQDLAVGMLKRLIHLDGITTPISERRFSRNGILLTTRGIHSNSRLSQHDESPPRVSILIWPLEQVENREN
jgi:hypothetical protein